MACECRDLKGKDFITVQQLAFRWSMSSQRVMDLVSKGVLLAWHPEGKEGCKGLLICVESVVNAKKNNYLYLAEVDDG